MKSLLIYVVFGLLLFVSVAAVGMPYNVTQMTETLTLLPELAGSTSATFMIYQGDWYAMSSASVSVSPSLSVSHYLDVGVSLGESISASCSAYQMPLSEYCKLSLSGSLSWLSLTLVEADPTLTLSSSLDVDLPLVPSGSPGLTVNATLAAQMTPHNASLSASITPVPFDVYASAYGSIRVFQTETQFGDHDATVTGSLSGSGTLTPIGWSYAKATVSVKSGSLKVSLSGTVYPGSPLSLKFALSHPLELF